MSEGVTQQKGVTSMRGDKSEGGGGNIHGQRGVRSQREEASYPLPSVSKFLLIFPRESCSV